MEKLSQHLENNIFNYNLIADVLRHNVVILKNRITDINFDNIERGFVIVCYSKHFGT